MGHPGLRFTIAQKHLRPKDASDVVPVAGRLRMINYLRYFWD
jgi:hypothetical protein